MTPKELADLATELNTRRYSRKGETEMVCTKASEAIRTILANGYAPEGMVLVPEEPTEAMVNAGWIDKEDVNPDDIYRAMLAAHKEKP
jgi:hypothetical protein